jgi:hypothetical protein
MKPFEKSAVWAIGKLHRFHLGQRHKLVDRIEDLRLTNNVLEETVAHLLGEIEWYENFTSESLAVEVDQFLNAGKDSHPARDNAYARMGKILQKVLEAPQQEKLRAVEVAARRLGVMCGNGQLCPLATSIALYRMGTEQSDLDPEDLTVSIVFDLRRGMDAARESRDELA